MILGEMIQLRVLQPPAKGFKPSQTPKCGVVRYMGPFMVEFPEIYIYMGVSKNRGVYPPKWMVKIMENPIKIDDLGGTPILGNTHIYIYGNGARKVFA